MLTNALSVKQAADYFGVKPYTISALCKSGYLPCEKVGHTWLVDASNLIKLRELIETRPKPGRRWRK